MAALRGKASRLAADQHPGSWLSAHCSAFTGMPTVGCVRSGFPVALQPRRIYAQGPKAIYCGKASSAPTTSAIKFVIPLMKLNNLHISNLSVGVSVSDFQPVGKTGTVPQAGEKALAVTRVAEWGTPPPERELHPDYSSLCSLSDSPLIPLLSLVPNTAGGVFSLG